MYSTSTQKKEWTLPADEIKARRLEANRSFRVRQSEVILEGEEAVFLSPEEELAMAKLIERAAIRFADSFNPPIWSSVRWTAYMYFKRLFLDWSVMDASPKGSYFGFQIVMMACFYLAMKIDEFYVTIDEFVSNLQSGTAEHNTSRILSLEPEIMRALKYHLTVHSPYRPLHGHIVEMKTRLLLLNFDPDQLRQPAEEFFRKALLTDVMLMYPPSQIALAAVQYGLDWLAQSQDALREYVRKLTGADDPSCDIIVASKQADAIVNRVGEIVNIVNTVSGMHVSDEDRNELQQRTSNWTNLSSVLEKRRLSQPKEQRKEESIDSDDD